jgi:HK97 family phage major capsid protein
MTKTLTIPKKIERSLSIETREINEEKQTLIFSFSSEEPYERWWGTEVLSHDPGACKLARLNNRANFLWNHDRDVVLGVLLRAWTENRRNYCEVRWSKEECAQKYWREILDGILSNVSCAYTIDEAVERDDNIVVTSWTPYEVSLVSVPADQTVGIGRSDEDPSAYKSIVIGGTTETRESKMEPEKSVDPKLLETERAVGAKAERDRQSAIRALTKKHGVESLGDELIDGGKSVEEARQAVLEKLGSRQQQPLSQPLASPLGLSEKEQKNYSLGRALAFLTGDCSREAAGFELEVSDAIAGQTKRNPKGLFFPALDLKVGKRDGYNVGNPSQGGNTVQTIIDETLFQYELLNDTLADKLGVTFMGSLTDNLSFIREEATPEIYWVGENEPADDSDGDFDLVNAEPHDAAGSVVVTRRMLQQSTMNSLPGGIEGYLRQRLREKCSLAIDTAIFNGSGSRFQPLGLLNMTDVPSIAIGANGGALTRNHVVGMMTGLMSRNAVNGSVRMSANTLLAGQMMLSEISTGSGRYLWEAMPGQEAYMGMVNGNIPAVMTNQLPGNLSKGSGSNLGVTIMGNFGRMMLMQWGTIDLEVNRYGRVWKQGGAEVRIIQSVDVQVARPDFFVVIKDARTT